MQRKRKLAKIPTSVWVVFDHNEREILPNTASVYVDSEDIGQLAPEEVVVHYRLVTTKKEQ